MMKSFVVIPVLMSAFALPAFAERTTQIQHANGDTTTVRTNNEGQTSVGHNVGGKEVSGAHYGGGDKGENHNSEVGKHTDSGGSHVVSDK